jgi:RNA polymerase sigma-70 factor (ECF subfamily)
MQQSLREIERLKPWLLAILRNAFLHKKRKTRREVEDPDGLMSAQLAIAAPQDSTVEFLDVLAALDRIPADQREALVLVYVDQVSYEEAAAIAGCPIGTLKSRVNRGRKSLHSELSQSASRDIRPNAAMHVAITEPIRTTRKS